MVTNPFTKQTILLNSTPQIGKRDRHAKRWKQAVDIHKTLKGTPKEAKAKALVAKTRSRSLEDMGIYVMPTGDGGPIDIYKQAPRTTSKPYKTPITEVPKTKFRKRKK